MTIEKLKFKPGYGGLKFGNSFWPGVRPSPDSIVKKLNAGISVAVFGLRRLGKSSLLAESRELLRSEGRSVVWVSLDSDDSLTKALSAILNSMSRGNEKEIVSSLKNWVENTDIFPPEVKSTISTMIMGRIDSETESFSENYIEALFREISQQFKLLPPEDKPIIILDEITLLIKNVIARADATETQKVIARLNSFLGMLRSWRSDDLGIKMAICGSISINWLHRKYGIRSELINDCVPIFIQEMEEDQARELINACVQALPPTNWNDQCTEELLYMLPAYYPGVIQLAYSVIFSEEISIESLKGPLRGLVYNAIWKEYFDQFERQFEDYCEIDRQRVNNLISTLDKKEDGIMSIRETLEVLENEKPKAHDIDGRRLLDQLVSDAFLDREPNGIKFTSGLVPAWQKMQLPT